MSSRCFFLAGGTQSTMASTAFQKLAAFCFENPDPQTTSFNPLYLLVLTR